MCRTMKSQQPQLFNILKMSNKNCIKFDTHQKTFKYLMEQLFNSDNIYCNI